MLYNSLEDIKQRFNINSIDENPQQVRKILLKKLSEFHPDRTGGTFSTAKREQQYSEIKEAIEFIDKLFSHSLVPVDQITQIIKSISEIIKPSLNEISLQKKKDIKNNISSEIKSKYFPIRVSSGVFSGIFAALLAFSGNISDNKFYGKYFQYEAFPLILAVLLFTSGTFFILTWFKEQKAERRKEWLFTEEGRIYLLKCIVKKKIQSQDIEANKFTFSEFVETIRYPRSIHNNKVFKFDTTPLVLFNIRLSLASAEELAKYHLSELKNNDIIKEMNNKSLSKAYIISKEIFDNLFS